MTVGKINKQSRSSQDEKTRKRRYRPELVAKQTKAGIGELKRRQRAFTPVMVTKSN
jgi:hypothetical protein